MGQNRSRLRFPGSGSNGSMIAHPTSPSLLS